MNRNQSIDLLRIILSVLVINVHIRILTGAPANFLEPLTWITVPLFVAISFYFYKKGPLTARLKRLFFPLFIWSIVGFMIHPELISPRNLILQVFTGHVVNTPLYFLVLLMIFTVLNHFFDKFPRKWYYFFLTSVTIGAFFLEYYGTNHRFFLGFEKPVSIAYGRFVELIKYWPLGIFISQIRKKILPSRSWFLASLLAASGIVAGMIPLPPDFHFSGLSTYFFTAAILIIASMNMTFKKLKFISSLSPYAFDTYLSHYPLLELIFRISQLRHFAYENSLGFLLLFSSSLYILTYVVFQYLPISFSFSTKRKSP